MKRTILISTLKLFAFIALLNIGVFAQDSLEGTRWQLTEINGRRVSDSKAFLEISQNQINGNAGCNRLFGGVRVSGRNIDFDEVGTTKMFCGGKGVMRLESDFLNALEKATRFRRNGGDLRIYGRNRQILRFKATGGDDNSSVRLEDKKWVLETINNKSLPRIETTPFINFDREKKSAGGNTGCNVFGGSYEANAETIKIFDVISTMRACIEDERMDVEREFKNGLQNANRYEIAGGKLRLYRDKALLMTFKAESK